MKNEQFYKETLVSNQLTIWLTGEKKGGNF